MGVLKLATIKFKVDKELKKQADYLFKKLGFDTDTALNLFLIQSVKEQAMPFKLAEDECELCKIYTKPSRSLKRALKEADKIISGKKKVKTYNNVDELFKDLSK